MGRNGNLKTPFLSISSSESELQTMYCSVHAAAADDDDDDGDDGLFCCGVCYVSGRRTT